jgi:CBS domain-containing protein
MKSASLLPTTRFRDAVLPRRSVSDGQFLDPSDPAIHAITDFTREYPVTVDEERQIDDALHDMIHQGVRAMLVVREQRIVGLITSYDICRQPPTPGTRRFESATS